MRRRKVWSLAPAAAFLAPLASCGSDDDDSGGSSPPSSETFVPMNGAEFIRGDGESVTPPAAGGATVDVTLVG